jgi:hypothetical protein
MADDVYCDGPGLKRPRVVFHPSPDGVAIEIHDDVVPPTLVHLRLSRDVLFNLLTLVWLEQKGTAPMGTMLEYPMYDVNELTVSTSPPASPDTDTTREGE